MNEIALDIYRMHKDFVENHKPFPQFCADGKKYIAFEVFQDQFNWLMENNGYSGFNDVDDVEKLKEYAFACQAMVWLIRGVYFRSSESEKQNPRQPFKPYIVK